MVIESMIHAYLWRLAYYSKLSLRYILHSIQWVLIDHVKRASSMRGERSDLDVHQQRLNI